MTHARLPVALPAYDAELVARQRAAIRTASVIAAVILVSFSALDRFTAPNAWAELLVVRLVAALLLAFIGQAAARVATPVRLAAIGVAVISGVIEAGAFATGGASSPYLISNIALLAGVGILLPLTFRQALMLQIVGLSVALLPVLPGLQRSEALTFATSASYLLTIAVVSVAGAHLQDRLRRGEHRARVEVARQMGLINLGTLAGGLAHEMANPLTYAGLELDQVLQAPLDASVRESVLAARTGLSRMQEILAAIRQGARFASGDLREVNLAEHVEQALTLIGQRLRSARVTVVRDFQKDVPLVSCQPTLLGQLLVNLMLNAVDAMAGRPDPRLTVRVRRDGGHTLVEVEDTGPGVPPELRARIFEPFFSTKGEGGNGLGLWISSEIAHVHGGALTALQGVRGAIFRLSLPLPTAQAATSAA